MNKKDFWMKSYLLTSGLIGMLFLLLCIIMVLYFVNYPNDVVSIFGAIGWVFVLLNETPRVIEKIRKCLEYRKR